MAIEAKTDTKAAKPRVSVGEFVRQVRVETARISWPTLPDTLRMMVMVMIMASFLALFFLGVDQVLGRIVKFLLSLAN